MRGSVFKRGNNWHIAFDVGLPGNRKQKTLSANKYLGKKATKKEAEALLAEMVQKVNSGNYIEPSKTSLKQYIEKSWLPNFTKRVSPHTVVRYKKIINLRIIPWLGDIQLDKLRPTHIRNFLNKVVDKGRMDGRPGKLSYQSIKYHKDVLFSILQTAMNDELIPRNPVKKVSLPVSKDDVILDKRKTVNAFTPEQVVIMEKALEAKSPYPYYELIAVDVRTGLRRGEILGLWWSDVDFENHTLTINRTLARTKERGMFLKDTAKNEKSMATIEISGKVIKLLEELRDKQNFYREKFKDEYELNLEKFGPLVFAREDGRPVYPESPTIWFQKFVKDLNLPPYNFHCLRHTCASLMILSGASLEEVSKFLRHSDISMTHRIYFHLLPGQHKTAAERLENLLKETKV